MPRPNVSEERKNQILEAAMTVFAERGFHEARMDDIAQKSGLSKGALYLYYKSKDAIIAAMLRYFFTLAMKNLRHMHTFEGSVSQQLLDYTRRIGAEAERMAFFTPIAWEFYAVAGRQKSVRLLLKDYFAEYRQTLAVLIQKGIDSGEFRQVNAETVATTVASLHEGLALLSVVDPKAVNWSEQGMEAVRLLLDGLRTR
ncbi:MAG: Transcriptional regulator, AcrR family [Ktedonobacterales bacterium]|jgi:AcrR family transcriptional regulator|nr:MAG: Transcriptional regulator, AcrR family [Ktedonobacterales bacterium]